MIGKTKSGFEFDVKEEALDNYRLLKTLNEVSRGNNGRVTEVVEMLLGSDQEERLMEHVEQINNGNCSATGMVAEIIQIFEAVKSKNSSSSPT
jgi:hypothetical protein